MKGKCLNQGGLSSWLQISSANIEFIKFQASIESLFEAAAIRNLLQSGFEDINLSIGAAMAVCSKCFVGSFFLCVVLCVYHIYGGPIEFI
jgi:hypothetical protein